MMAGLQIVDPLNVGGTAVIIPGEDTESDEEDYDVINNHKKVEVKDETSKTTNKSDFLSSLSSAFGITSAAPPTITDVAKLRQLNGRYWLQKQRLESGFATQGMTNIRKFSRNYDLNQQMTIRCSDNVRKIKDLVTDSVQCCGEIVSDGSKILRMKLDKT